MATAVVCILLILIVALSALVGMKRGFVRSVAGIVEYILAFMAANRFYVALSSLVKKIPFIANMITDVEMPALEANAGFFAKVGAIISYIMDNAVLGGKDPSEQTQAIVNNYIADAISKAIAFVSLFIVSLLILKLVVALIDRFCNLPFLHFTNKTLGIIFGLFFGLFITWILSNLFSNHLLPILSEKYPETFTLGMKDNAIIKFFTNYSPVALIMYIVNLISSIGVK